LISPVLACASFMAQAIVLFAVYGRYFFRAKDLFKD